METPPKRSDKDAALKIALALIDPSGTLEPGTEEYEEIVSTIISWIDHYGPVDALEMVKRSKKMLEDASKLK